MALRRAHRHLSSSQQQSNPVPRSFRELSESDRHSDKTDPSIEKIASTYVILDAAHGSAILFGVQSHATTQVRHLYWQRWLVCLLLFLATSINYMDRAVLGILAKTLDTVLHWSEDEYGYVVVAFTLAYGVGYLVAGRVVDRIGAKYGYALFVFLWTVAAIAHAAVSTVFGFGVARFALGFAESGNFPAAIRAISENFPPEEQALATGLFNSGSNASSLIAPFFIAFILHRFGSWRYCFVGVGSLGFGWLALWLLLPYNRYRRKPEAATEAKEGSPMSWNKLLKLRQTWAFLIIKAMTDPVWWLYLFWLPKFLQTRFHLSVDQLGVPLATVYCISSLGAVAGGWCSGFLIRRGAAPIDARKAVLAVCSAMALLLIAGTHLRTVASTVALFASLTAAHQAWAANLFVANADLFPRASLSSAVGLGGAAGALGGAAFQAFTGHVLQVTHENYMPVFLVAALAYPVSLLAFHLLTRRGAVTDTA